MGCGGSVRNVPLLAMRKIREQEVALGRALSGERPGQDRHEPIHGGFGKNILFFTILAGPLARQSAPKCQLMPDRAHLHQRTNRTCRAQRVNLARRELRPSHALRAHEPRGWRGVGASRIGRFRDREKQDVFPEAPMDGFMAVPKTPDTTCPDATQSVRLQVS